MHQSGHHPFEQETILPMSVPHTSSNIEVAPQSSTDTSEGCPICGNCGGKHNTIGSSKPNTSSYGSQLSATNYSVGTLDQQLQFAPSGQQPFQTVPSGYQSVHGASPRYQMQNINKQRHLWRIVTTHKASCPEMEQIGKGRSSQRMSTLGKLYLFLSVLLVQGRLQYLDLSYGTKHPIREPLPHVSSLVRLQHIYLRRAGLETTLTLLRIRIYFTGATKLEHNVRQAPPFIECGMDCAGPLYCKRSSKKHYILLCTCVTTRRIHLKLTILWNLPDCIHAFKKMVARQGDPAGVYTDNACSLVAAATEPTGV